LIAVPANWAPGLSLALYELGANSLKYGALNGGGGEARISWKADSGRCVLRWRETAPAPHLYVEGFGAQLVRAAFGMHKNTAVRYEIGAHGVLCEFEWPCGKPPAPEQARAA